VRLVFVSTDNPEINIDRVQRRFEDGGHTVPTDKIKARYQRSMNNLVPGLNIADRGYVFDNTAENSGHKILFRTVEGKIEKTYEKTLPEWAQQVSIQLEKKVPIHTQTLETKAARDSILDAVSSRGSILGNALKEKKMEQERERKHARHARILKSKGPSHER